MATLEELEKKEKKRKKLKTIVIGALTAGLCLAIFIPSIYFSPTRIAKQYHAAFATLEQRTTEDGTVFYPIYEEHYKRFLKLGLLWSDYYAMRLTPGVLKKYIKMYSAEALIESLYKLTATYYDYNDDWGKDTDYSYALSGDPDRISGDTIGRICANMLATGLVPISDFQALANSEGYYGGTQAEDSGKTYYGDWAVEAETVVDSTGRTKGYYEKQKTKSGIVLDDPNQGGTWHDGSYYVIDHTEYSLFYKGKLVSKTQYHYSTSGEDDLHWYLFDSEKASYLIILDKDRVADILPAK
ncbi:MAG: hypothetical protein IK080_04565 [Clostridia bacterium]|nr:hypothetical protein [Clostridia bacterium]